MRYRTKIAEQILGKFQSQENRNNRYDIELRYIASMPIGYDLKSKDATIVLIYILRSALDLRYVNFSLIESTMNPFQRFGKHFNCGML